MNSDLRVMDYVYSAVPYNIGFTPGEEDGPQNHYGTVVNDVEPDVVAVRLLNERIAACRRSSLVVVSDKTYKKVESICKALKALR